MNCPQCQQPLRDGAQFCTNCGMRSVQMPAAAAAASRAAETEASAGDAAGEISTGGNNAATFVGGSGGSGDDPFIGRVLDSKYQIISRLGEGGMGAVYRARRVHIGDEVAVKLLHSKYVTDAAAVERFRREARAAAQLHHSNVVTIHDYGEVGGSDPHTFIVMELVAGESLRDVLKREGRFEPERTVALMKGICAGVGAAHRHNIVHRDIKPDNIIVIPPEPDGEPEKAKVVDFGIAKLRDLAAADHNLTQTGSVVGTPYYMSPEQCRGDSLDARSDVYSLGALLYEMLSGTPPFTARTMTGIVAKHLTEAPSPFADALAVPPALEAVAMRALSKDPDARPADASALARELQTTSKQLAAQSAEQSAPSHPAVVAPVVPAQVTPPPQFSAPTNPPVHHAPTNPPHIPPHTAPQPSQVTLDATPKKRSRAPLFVGLLVVGGIVLLGGIGIIALIIGNMDGKSGASNRNAARPTPAPTASGSPAAKKNYPPPANRMERIEASIVGGQSLAKDALAGLSPTDLRLLRNVVFARHGRIYTTPELKNYFEKRPWYSPSGSYDESNLTDVDRANLALIQLVETGGSAKSQADSNALREEVRSSLEGWAATTREHDLDAHMSYYAPALETYYRSTGVSMNTVRNDRQRAFTRFTDLDVQLSNVQITLDPSGTRAIAVFNKEWDFDGESTGEVRQQIIFTKLANRWLITGEKDLSVLDKQ